jgi:hypothetical protein
MSNQIQNEISQTEQKIAQLTRANEVNISKAVESWSMGDYGHGNFMDQINNNPLTKQIAELTNYKNALIGILHGNYSEQEKLQALNQIKQYKPNSSYYGSEFGGRRYRKKSLKRGKKTMKKRNTRRRK